MLVWVALRRTADLKFQIPNPQFAIRNPKFLWRRGWDSNPRNGSPFTAFPVLPIQPLLHLSPGRTSDCGFRIRLWALKFRNPRFAIRNSSGGEGGIRTHGGRKPTPVFETGALIHYATSPLTRSFRSGLPPAQSGGSPTLNDWTYRLVLKNSCISARHSASRIPLTISTR